MSAKMKVGDPVVLRGEVTHVEGDQVTVKVSGSRPSADLANRLRRAKAPG